MSSNILFFFVSACVLSFFAVSQSGKLSFSSVFNVAVVVVSSWFVFCLFSPSSSFFELSFSVSSPCAVSRSFSAFSSVMQSRPRELHFFIFSFDLVSTCVFASFTATSNSSSDFSSTSMSRSGFSMQSDIVILSCSSNSSNEVFAFSASVFALFFLSRSSASFF